MTTYKHLSADERDQIAILRAAGKSIRQIARILHRCPSSLSRELRRNCPPVHKHRYRPRRAQQRADLRKSSASSRPRLKSPLLRDYVAAKLRLRWSPELIAGRLPLDLPGLSISYEAIYQWIYDCAREFIPFLPKSHRKRMHRGFVPGKHSRGRIPSRVPISLRPPSVNSRRIVGHWEVDTAGNHKSPRSLLVILERKTRFAKLRLLPRRGAVHVHRALVKALRVLPPAFRRTLTYDNGNENCAHLLTNKRLNTRSYFCAPFHSWEKGSVENAIGVLRLLLPKSLDLNLLSSRDVRLLERWINDRPRKCLKFSTPAEFFQRLSSCATFKPALRSKHPAKRRR